MGDSSLESQVELTESQNEPIIPNSSTTSVRKSVRSLRVASLPSNLTIKLCPSRRTQPTKSQKHDGHGRLVRFTKNNGHR